MSHESNISSDVKKHGWSAIDINDREPPFVYSVGLMYTYSHPEIIIMGLPGEGINVLSAMVDNIIKGYSYSKPSKYKNVLINELIETRCVHETQHELWMGYAMGYWREQRQVGQLKAIQVFWPDNCGRFPFDANCDNKSISLQIRLDRPWGHI